MQLTTQTRGNWGADCPRIAPARDSVPHTSTPAPISEWGGEAPSAGSPRFRVRQTEDGVFCFCLFFSLGMAVCDFLFLARSAERRGRVAKARERDAALAGCHGDASLPFGWAELGEPWNLFDAGQGSFGRAVGSRHPDFIPPTATGLKVSITDVEHQNENQNCGHLKIKHLRASLFLPISGELDDIKISLQPSEPNLLHPALFPSSAPPRWLQYCAGGSLPAFSAPLGSRLSRLHLTWDIF